MESFFWPASVVVSENQFTLNFPDWPEEIAHGHNLQEVMVAGTISLSKAVSYRIENKLEIPSPSELAPRQILIAISDTVSAHLNEYLKNRQKESFQEHTEIMKARRERRTEFLTEFHSAVDPSEQRLKQCDNAAVEFSLVGIRSCYILNAGGLVAIPAIMQILGPSSGTFENVFQPSVIFILGVACAALTNFAAYHSTMTAGKAWHFESQARRLEISGNYYPPDNQKEHDAQITQCRADSERRHKTAVKVSNLGVAGYATSVALFLMGVGLTVFNLSS